MESLKTLALVICATATVWFVLSFSHLDEIGFMSWAMDSSAVTHIFAIMKGTFSMNMCLIRILISLLLRMIIGWFVSVIILSIARIPEVIVLLSMFFINMSVNSGSNWINNGATIWREINRYPPNTKNLVPIGGRVSFYGERVMFGGKSSSPKSLVGRSYLGYYALCVLCTLNDLALLHEKCFQLGWHFLCLCTLGLLIPILELHSQVKRLIQRSMSILPNRHFFLKLPFFGYDPHDGGDQDGKDSHQHERSTDGYDSSNEGDHRRHKRHRSPNGYDSTLEGDRESGYDSMLGGDHGKSIPRNYSVHLALDGTSIFNRWISATSVDDVRSQIRHGFDISLKTKRLQFAPKNFLLSAKVRGRLRFLTSEEEMYDGIRIIISAPGRGGQPKKAPMTLPETPSPDRVPPPKFGSLIPRYGASNAERTTVASEEDQRRSVRFTDVGALESRLKEAESRAESESKRASVIERQLEDMTETLKRLTEEREREEREKSPPRPRTLEFNVSPKDKNDKEPPDGNTAKVYLGTSPPPLDTLADVSDKKVAERLPVVVEWLQSLRSWIQETVSPGDVVYDALRDAADEYYQRWLNLTGNPFKLANLTFEDITNGNPTFDHGFYEEFLLRSYGKIIKALPKRLSSALKEDIAAAALTPFQRLVGVIVTVLINFAVTNMNEHVALFGALHSPSQWLNGTHVKDGPSGWSSLATYDRTLKFAQQLPRVTQLDVGKLILGVRNLVNEMMSLLDKLEADAMSEHVRQDGLFDYNCKLESLVAIVKMCQNVARVSSSFRKNFKERSEKKDKEKKDREKKRGNLAHKPTEQPSDTLATDDQQTPAAHQAKAKEKGQKGRKGGMGGKGAKGAGKNNEQDTPHDGKSGGDPSKGSQKEAKKCTVCGKTLAEHPDKKWCIPLCYECGKPLAEHPNKRWCPRKNGQSPSETAGQPPHT